MSTCLIHKWCTHALYVIHLYLKAQAHIALEKTVLFLTSYSL